ncbi:zinc protease [Arboricoccus pini]|uniref:Zinc protease n=1 Tax=Arboricoccus pini TaxID=1963835 RepID=A0A212Q3K1_9PROT|nr:pitrilysin family protein [Arboricoccus pini]SNB53935.1 zinc protease [Arboricoccus pini]
MTTMISERTANKVQEIRTRSGIRAYLINEPTLPFISMSFRTPAGAAFDPVGAEGLSYMATALLDEGAGSYDSQAFQAELEDNAIRLSFDADRDAISGSLLTLNATREHAFELLRLALHEPRFDSEPVARVRSQILAELDRLETSPNFQASRVWFEQAFASHSYGRPTRGTIASIKGMSKDSLNGFVRSRLARRDLAIGVSGDITAAELSTLLDRTFGDLPETVALPAVGPATPILGQTYILPLPLPQSVVTFGTTGIERHDPDYYAAYMLNYILGGGGFSSRLMEEVREKRGLAYSVYSQLYDTRFAPLWLGSVATSNAQVAQSIALVRQEIEKLAAGEISEIDRANACTYLTGSFPLRLTSNDQVARMLVGMMAHDLGADYLATRNGFIEAVTLEDLKRVAARCLTQPLSVSIVGAPEGIEAAVTLRRKDGIRQADEPVLAD